MIPLFNTYPALQGHIPFVSLADLPTPVERLESIEQALGIESLYLKRDDQSARPFGGNKVRKLEFLLAEAQRLGRPEVLTFGGAGSNHAACTAVYAHKLGMHCISILMPQPNAYSLRRNLLLAFRHGAELHMASSPAQKWALTARRMLAGARNTGQLPLRIPIGGATPLGCLGFVNAAFELKRQVDAGMLPKPDVIYVAAGSGGTTAGLLLGIELLGLDTRVEAIRVIGTQVVNPSKLQRLYTGTLAHLRRQDPSLPQPAYPASKVQLRGDFFGPEYGRFTPEGAEARDYMAEHAGIPLDGVYTAKAFAAMMHDARAGLLEDQRVLFWNTYNSNDFSHEIAEINYHDLPSPFHAYFERDVQPLDRPLESGST